MKVFIQFLFILFLSGSPSLSNCHQKAMKGLLKDHGPASFYEFKVAEAKLMNLGDRAKYMLHLRGEFTYLQHGGRSQTLLESGLHTQQAIEFLKKMRPDVAKNIT